MLSEKFEVTGVDFSEAQIELAKKKVPNATFLCEDMTKLDFAENTFDGIASYYAIIHVPREEHRSLLINFHRMLKSDGLALLCLGAELSTDDPDDEFFDIPMYWSHFGSETNLKMLKDCGFTILWSKLVRDSTCEGAAHLFVLVQKGMA
jgi:ubiquinone/menaquinone biosynthesis C-methylase UbiE